MWIPPNRVSCPMAGALISPVYVYVSANIKYQAGIPKAAACQSRRLLMPIVTWRWFTLRFHMPRPSCTFLTATAQGMRKLHLSEEYCIFLYTSRNDATNLVQNPLHSTGNAPHYTTHTETRQQLAGCLGYSLARLQSHDRRYLKIFSCMGSFTKSSIFCTGPFCVAAA